MQKYIALLRGVNVSGKNRIRMDDLKKLLETIGFSYVTTYIQSGNIVFDSKKESEKILQKKIETAIKSHFGWDVLVLVIKKEYLEMVLDRNPFALKITQGIFDEKKMYYTLLSEIPDATNCDAIPISIKDGGEHYEILPQHKIVYVYAANGYGRTKLSTNFFERTFKVRATTRNMNTLRKLVSLSAD